MTLEPASIDGLRAALVALDAVVADRLGGRGLAGGASPDLVDRLLHRPVAETGVDDGLPDLASYGRAGRLRELVDRCELDPLDALLVVAALAPLLDERYAVLFGLLDDTGRARALTVDVARTLGARSFEGRLGVDDRLHPSSRLCAGGLVLVDPTDEHGVRSVRIDPDLGAWLLGRERPDPSADAHFPATALTTVHGLDDLVLPRSIRRRLVHGLDRIRLQDRVIDDFGFGEHFDAVRGVTLLFHGPPGTGKTMAAAVLAREAGLPAYAISLPAMVSKYIGETARNLERVFDRAERERCVLFFDEADAIFGSRTAVADAHDRYANQDVSYLLQRLETYTGTVILASNLLANIDDAFRRRIDVLVEFTAPGVAERRELWKRALPDRLPRAAEMDVAVLADRYELSGAEIRNAVLEAGFVSAADDAPVTLAVLEQAVRVQLAKGGRSVPPPAGG